MTRDAGLGEFVDLAVAFLEGRADAEQVAALNASLEADAARRDLFVRLSLTPGLIGEAMSEVPDAAIETGKSEADAGPARLAFRVPRWTYALSGVAAALLLAAAAVAIYLLAFNPRPESRDSKPNAPLATILDTTDGTLVVNDRVANPGDEIAAGDLSLDAGSADFRMTNGVAVSLRGASQLTVHDPMHATLIRGDATFDCPHDAVGYTVHLPGGIRVVDLGTAFTVRIGEDGGRRVRVTQGRVEVRHGDRQLAVLSARQQLVIAADGRPGPVVIAAPAVLVDHYPFDGDGDDVAGNDSVALVGEPVRFVEGRIGTAAHFPATAPANARVGVPHVHAFDPGVGGFSIAFWVRRDSPDPSAGPAGVIDALEGESTGYHLAFGHGELVLRLDGRTTHVVARAAIKAVDPTAYHHYAIAVDRSTDEPCIGFYEDGVLIAAVPIGSLAATDALSPTQGMAIGMFNGRDGLAGALDDLRFYTGVLAPNEVRDLYDSGRVTPIDPSTHPHEAGTADRPRASPEGDSGAGGKTHPPVKE